MGCKFKVGDKIRLRIDFSCGFDNINQAAKDRMVFTVMKISADGDIKFDTSNLPVIDNPSASFWPFSTGSLSPHYLELVSEYLNLDFGGEG